MNTVIFKSKPRHKLAKLCLDNHLYVNGWALKRTLEILYYLHDHKEYDINYDIVVGFINNKPVGVIVLTDTVFNTFVKPAFRRQKIGTKLYNELIKITKKDYKNIPMRKGGKDSESFFTSLDHKFEDVSLEQMFGLEQIESELPSVLTKW